MRFLIFFLLAHSIVLAGPVRDKFVVAELVPVTDAIVPGEILTVCLNIKHDPKWHTYWKNPGIAGVPTKLHWDLPEGFTAGPIQWARPQNVKMAIYNTNGYEGEVTLLIDIETPEDLKPGEEIELKTKTTWMMCARDCHPSSANLSLKIPVATEAKPHPRGAKLAEETRATMPVENQKWKTSARLGEESVTLDLTLLKGSQDSSIPDSLHFFSGDGLVDSHPEQKVERVSDTQFRMTLARSEFGPKNPQSLDGVLLTETGDKSQAITISAKFSNP